MKKWLLGSLTAVALLMAACGQEEMNTEETETTEEVSEMEETAESTETAEEETEEAEDATSRATEEYEGASIDDLEEEYDVIVIGAGGAGMASAIQAHDAGADVVVFEKMPIAGGNTVKASAGMNAAGTSFQEAKDIEDEPELFFEESLEGGHGENDQELLSYMTENSASAIEWLDSLDITLDNITTTGGMSVPRAHRPTDGSAIGGYLVDGLLDNLEERDVPIYLNSEVSKLMEEDGTVTGVEVTVNQTDEAIISADAVVIASGGFGADYEMLTEYNPELEGSVTTNHEGATGDGIKMAEEIGGDTLHMEYIQVHPTVDQGDGLLLSESLRGEGAILINQDGERFFDELNTRDAVSQAVREQEGGYAYLIADSALRERVPAVDYYESEGVVLEEDSIEALAEAIEVDEENLEETLNTWNESVATGEDSEHGRTTGMEIALSEAPYFAIRIAPGIHHTMGGIKINANTEVLDDAGAVIPGLYAAGEVTGGLHGANRIGGNAVADIIVFGRQSGTQAAELATAAE